MSNPLDPRSAFTNQDPHSGALTAEDIDRLLKNPYSKVSQDLIGFSVSQAIEIQRSIAESIRITKLLEMESQQYYAIYQLLSKSSSPWGLAQEHKDDRTFETLIQSQTTNKTNHLKDLSTQLTFEQNKLLDLVKERNIFLSDLWADQRKQQSQELFLKLEEVNVHLSDNEKHMMQHVKKGQEIILKHPEIIPENANVDTIMNKSEINKNITLLRIMKGHEDNKNPDEIIRILPSDVKRFQEKIGGILTAHTDNCKQSDKRALQNAQTRLDDYNNLIDNQSKKIDSLQLKITLELNYPEVARKIEAVRTMSTNPKKSESENQNNFEYHLQRIIERMSTSEREAFRNDCEKSLPTLNESQTAYNDVMHALKVEEGIPKLSRGMNSHR